MTSIHSIETTAEDRAIIQAALSVYSSLGTGQLEVLDLLLKQGVLPTKAGALTSARLNAALLDIKQELGLAPDECVPLADAAVAPEVRAAYRLEQLFKRLPPAAA